MEEGVISKVLLCWPSGSSNALWIRTLSGLPSKSETKDRCRYQRMEGKETKENLLVGKSSLGDVKSNWSHCSCVMFCMICFMRLIAALLTVMNTLLFNLCAYLGALIYYKYIVSVLQSEHQRFCGFRCCIWVLLQSHIQQTLELLPCSGFSTLISCLHILTKLLLLLPCPVLASCKMVGCRTNSALRDSDLLCPGLVFPCW